MTIASRRHLRRRGERGAAAVEFMGVLWLLLFCALVAWQLLLVASTVTATENAARTASRALVVHGGGDVTGYAHDALPPWLARNATATGGRGGFVTVTVRVPIIAPLFTSEDFVISRRAYLP